MYAIQPPSWQRASLASGSLALGAVLVFDLEDGLSAVAPTVTAQNRAPWCPLAVVVSSGPVTPAIHAAVRGLGPGAFFVGRGTSGAPPGPEDILGALRAYPPPRSGALARYVARRTGRDDLTDLLRVALSNQQPIVEHRTPSRSTFSRRLSEFGELTQRDWRTAARLIQVLHRLPHPGATVEQAAWAGGLDPRTLRDSCSRLLDMSVPRAIELPGWEWKLEAVLRRFGYVSSEPSETRRRRPSDEFQLV